MDAPHHVLAIGPHPGTVECFAGAALARLADSGAGLSLVVCSDGARGRGAGPELAGIRRREAERSAHALGASVRFLGAPDGDLADWEDLCRDLVRAIRETRPEIVLAPDPTTHWRPAGSVVRLGHPDHRAVGEAALDAIHPRAACPAFHPDLPGSGWIVREVWLFDTARPDHLVRCGAGLERKRAALGEHVSQGGTHMLNACDPVGGSESLDEEVAVEAFRRLVLL